MHACVCVCACKGVSGCVCVHVCVCVYAFMFKWNSLLVHMICLLAIQYVGVMMSIAHKCAHAYRTTIEQ